MANAIHFPTSVAVNDELVYWTSYGDCPIDEEDLGEGKVFGMRRRDGSNAFVIDKVACPASLVASGDDLFWVDRFFGGGWISTAKRDGTQVRAFLKGLALPVAVRVDARDLYYAVSDGIYRVDRLAPATPQLFARIDLLDGITRSPLVLDDTNVYWIDQSPDAKGGVFRAAKADGVREQLAAVDRPHELAISTAGLFWAAESFGKPLLAFLAWGDATPQVLSMRALRPNSLAALGNDLYWTEGDADHQGGVYHMALGKPDVATIAMEAAPASITADNQFVFWTDSNDPNDYNGRVMRVCR